MKAGSLRQWRFFMVNASSASWAKWTWTYCIIQLAVVTVGCVLGSSAALQCQPWLVPQPLSRVILDGGRFNKMNVELENTMTGHDVSKQKPQTIVNWNSKVSRTVGSFQEKGCSRRQSFASASSWLFSQFLLSGAPPLSWADTTELEALHMTPQFEIRNRNGNKDALIREDYWYMLGRTPPRLLGGPVKGANDPQWNAFGSCESEVGGPNPCTYVSLTLRIPAYSKYASSIAYGSQQYEKLGQVLRRLQTHTNNAVDDTPDPLWRGASEFYAYGSDGSSSTFPSPIVDAELKLILFATAMTTSPNFPQPSRELLLARYYANEIHYVNQQLASETTGRNKDATRALALWEYGRDAWNSYFQIVNQHVSPKVGDPFPLIGAA
jgi:hypothetical protein